MVTFRWNGKIQHLITYVRFGGGNKVKDHVSAGELSVCVNDDGVLNSFGLDARCVKHEQHPTTGYSFKKKPIKIPNYDLI